MLDINVKTIDGQSRSFSVPDNVTGLDLTNQISIYSILTFISAPK
jgi:hypothetical protein